MVKISEFYVYNSLNPNKVVKFNITFRYFVIKGVEGEHVWTLEIGTTYLDSNGNSISPARVHNISVEDFDEVIENALITLCSQIDWSPLSNDITAPKVSYVFPYDGESEVNIGRDIYITIVDDLPTAGIDLSEMKIVLNNETQDFDITSEVNIEGDPYEYNLRWVTPLRVYSRYNT